MQQFVINSEVLFIGSINMLSYLVMVDKIKVAIGIKLRKFVAYVAVVSRIP